LGAPCSLLVIGEVDESDERIAVTVYGLNLLAISAFIAIVWHYALWQRLVTKDNSENDVRALPAKLDPSLVSYAAVIGLGLWQPKIAVILYLVIALFMIISVPERPPGGPAQEKAVTSGQLRQPITCPNDHKSDFGTESSHRGDVATPTADTNELEHPRTQTGDPSAPSQATDYAGQLGQALQAGIRCSSRSSRTAVSGLDTAVPGRWSGRINMSLSGIISC
jgi:hypothetical protein